MRPAVLIPVKSFGAAKARLTGYLTPDERRMLARWMADRVVTAAGDVPVFVVCDDEEVARWAETRRADVIWTPGLGLNGAVDHGAATIAGKGFDHLTIAHGDLPLADGLDTLRRPGTVVIIPDRRRDGTNVLSRPTAVPLPAAYGPGSYHHHLAAAMASGAAVTVGGDDRFTLDLDTPADCRDRDVAPLLEELFGRHLPEDGA